MEKDDGYSSGDSESNMRASMILNVSNLAYGDDPNAYKKDKNCLVCKKSFSMMGAMKKHYCKFCFHGVCAGCSKHRAPDNSNKNVRICDSCYQRAIQDQVRENLQKDVDKVTKELEDLKKVFNTEKEQRKHESRRRDALEQKLEEVKYENERREKELNDQSDNLKKEIKMMEMEIEELMRILSSADTDKKDRESKITNLKVEIGIMKTETQNDSEKINDLRRLISEQEKENEALTKELNARTELPVDLDDPLNKTSLLDGLKAKVAQAKDQYKDLKKDNENLKKKVATLREENSNKKAEVAKIEEAGGRRRAYSKVTSDIKDLEDQIAYQEQEIIRLQEKLQSPTPK